MSFYEIWNQNRDIVSMAKKLWVVGMPIGAICATAEVAKAFTPISWYDFWRTSGMRCAAALAEVNELLIGILQEMLQR